MIVPERYAQPIAARRRALAGRASAMRERVHRLYAVVDAAERRAQERHRQVEELRASADAICACAYRIAERPFSTGGSSS